MSGSRALEVSGVSLIVAAAVLSACSCVSMIVDRLRVDEKPFAAEIESAERIRASGEAREFDARVGALRIVSVSENARLGRALGGIEAIRRIEEQSGRSSATDEAIALGFNEARESIVGARPTAAVELEALLAAAASVGAALAAMLFVAVLGRRRIDRRRIAAGIGLDVELGEVDAFADQVLLQWIRRGGHSSVRQQREEDVPAQRTRSEVVAPDTGPPSSPLDELGSSFGPTRRR